MGDVARTLGANPLPAKLTKELLLPDLTAAVHRLMGSLAAWRLASTVRQAVRDQQPATETDRLYGSPQTRAWLDQQGKASWHDSLNQLSDVVASPEWAKGIQGESRIDPVGNSPRASRSPGSGCHADRLTKNGIESGIGRIGCAGYADRPGCAEPGSGSFITISSTIRSRSCSLLFPPAGNTQATLPGLVETIVLGENVYLRWEIDGRVQEDSLQFSKEGQRLEGTFVNSQGGWGSISGKRTAGCAP